MKRLLETSIIEGFVLSAQTELGPQIIYTFPKIIEEETNQAKRGGEPDKRKDYNCLRLTQQQFMQITIKNLSLVLTDEISASEHEQKPQYFCIIPFPDFNITALTYYNYLNDDIIAFSLLVHENNRHFLYNNHKTLKNFIIEFSESFNKRIASDFIPQEDAAPYFESLMAEIKKLEQQKLGPAINERKMKIILAGLDDSGKTSFLLTVDRKFSKLMNIKPTAGAKVQSIQALGASLFVWDLGGQRKYLTKYLTKSSIYLYESDLIFYFIDVQNKQRFEESFEYLKNIHRILYNELKQDTPIVYIFSKGDLDIIEDKQIQKNIKYLKSKIKEITKQKEIDVYVTSIFEITTILRSFSAGISELSFNRKLINHNLKRFSKRINSYITLLLSDEGLVLSNYYSPKISPKQVLQDVFEITAPQFTTIYKIFYKFKALNKSEAIFRVSSSVILIKRIKILGRPTFLLLLLDNLEKEKKINKLLPDFLERIKSLLSTYL